MPSYNEALDLLTTEAQLAPPTTETVPLCDALNRISKCEYRSPFSTPKHDTSAMDGYALNAAATRTASPSTPIVFHVAGTMAAGDAAMVISGEPDSDASVYPCVEIMTGACFPEAIEGDQRPFDACVKLEDVDVLVGRGERPSGNRYIQVVKPLDANQNRRLAGGDFSEGDIVVEAGTRIQPRHIMALAAVGVKEVEVVRRIKVGVFSTGNELSADARSRVQDINGPYVTACLRDWCIDVDFLGVLDDVAETMVSELESRLRGNKYDIIISTGGVSTGRFDLIPAALEDLFARVVFHKIAIRPGHPGLFAKLPMPDANGPETAFFGMPGNPVASAAFLRFLVLPYVQRLQGQSPESAFKATIRRYHNDLETNGAIKHDTNGFGSLLSTCPVDKDVFRPGVFHRHEASKLDVMLINDHGPGKIKPFLGSNCWIHIPQGKSDLYEGDIVDVFLNE
ncbi:molybdopterin molybdotransferase MoeA [Aspergillus ruber CBS 135680]|uniref:molybdopterin adenylyltransferase n=1 Tax=Aspergillus ruber (strain CBS 135680) TaxID=1388766 RepID=A0A017S0R8_ASPRC|nr:molybdenum cofactor biosynthesis protein [Aspergillus ruber CBS 135680]EYE90613.1 molybdenum cofactor biosynthesis protein [Aspergillus ruber CBS 135680]